MQNSMRLFISIELSPEIHDQLSKLIAELKKDGCSSIKWVKPENIHLTLKFLGDTASTKLPELQQRISSVCNSVKPFRITVLGTGGFPSRKTPKVLWAGLNAEEALDHLYHALDAEMAKFGFPKENRPFSPHLTLARIPSPAESPALDSTLKHLFNVQNKNFGMVIVRRITLFQSTLASGGSIYTPLFRFQLSE
jgi:RNA 2',3'-cyclic 3'-phosphodiesterase